MPIVQRRFIAVALFLSTLAPLQNLSSESKSSSVGDYAPAAAAGIVALGLASAIKSYQCPSELSACVLAALSIVPIYLFAGSAIHWGMEKLGYETKVCTIAPSQNSLKRNKEAWLRLFMQIFHPKNVGQFVPLLGLELGLNDNYAIVDEGKLYRSAKYDADKFSDYIDQEELSCALNLMSKVVDKDSWDELEGVARKTKTKLINIALSGSAMYSAQDLKALLGIIHNDDNYPLHVNCRHGKDRTGFFCGIYLLEVKGYNIEQAIEEQLSYKKYNHFECHLPYICAILRKWHEIRLAQDYAKDQESLNAALGQYQAWYQDHTS